jgi:hypothetical protein
MEFLANPCFLWHSNEFEGKREGMAQCAGDDFQGRLRESAEVCPA